MKIYEVVKEALNYPSKTFKCTVRDWTIKTSSSGGLSIQKNDGKRISTDTLLITGEIVLLDWREIRKPVSAVDALSLKDKKIKPVGYSEFATSEEWLLNICENRSLLKSLWEVE